MKSVEGKNVLITGAAKGMGRLFAERAIAEGASAVVLWDVDESALNDTLAELAGGHCEVSGYIVDVSDAAAVVDTAAAVLEDLGRIDVLVNNAGVVRGNQYFWETDLDRDTKFTMDVNTLAPMYVAHEFLPAMIAASGDCRMVNLASDKSSDDPEPDNLRTGHLTPVEVMAWHLFGQTGDATNISVAQHHERGNDGHRHQDQQLHKVAGADCP